VLPSPSVRATQIRPRWDPSMIAPGGRSHASSNAGEPVAVSQLPPRFSVVRAREREAKGGCSIGDTLNPCPPSVQFDDSLRDVGAQAKRGTGVDHRRKPARRSWDAETSGQSSDGIDISSVRVSLYLPPQWKRRCFTEQNNAVSIVAGGWR
jgi:hypothetical protein